MSVIDKGFNKMPVPPPLDSPPQNTLERTLEGLVPFFGPFGAHTYSLVPKTPSSKVTGRQSFRSLISGCVHTMEPTTASVANIDWLLVLMWTQGVNI